MKSCLDCLDIRAFAAVTWTVGAAGRGAGPGTGALGEGARAETWGSGDTAEAEARRLRSEV